MPRPLLHPRTEVDLDRLPTSNHHAIALIGPYGAGKHYVAEWLAHRLLEVEKTSAEQVKYIAPDSGSIGIDDIRQVQNYLRLKSTGTGIVRRVVIIEDAQSMTLEAQNALLKALEEPPEDVRFILTVAGEHSLLPTVYSRVHNVRILPVTEKALQDYFKDIKGPNAVKKAWAISGGHVGLAASLLTNDSDALTDSISQAKQLINQPLYERLLIVDKISKDKAAVRQLLFALKRVLSAVLSASTAKAKNSQAQKIVFSLKTIHDAEASIERNANVKLVLTDVILNL